MPAPPSSPEPSTASGVRVSRGVTFAIPPGGIIVDATTGTMKLVQFHLRLNLAIEWLEIAVEHLQAAEASQREWLDQQERGEDINPALNREFKASMQAMVASGTFFEALYSATREAMPTALRATATEGRGKGKRSAVVIEQLKRAYGLRKNGTANLTSVVSEIYRFREEAVHPSASFGPPAIHPLLGQYVERRVAMFTFPNAKLLVRATLAYAKILPTIGQKRGPAEAKDLCTYLLASCQPLVTVWENNYGPLLKAAA